MKRTLVFKTKFVSLCSLLVGGLLTFSNSATAFSIRDAHEARSVPSSAASRHNDESSYVNNLIGMFLRSDERSNAFRSDNVRPHLVLHDHAAAPAAGRRSVEVRMPSGWVFGPPPRGSGVPDGGITAMLLGAALGALGIARRYIRS